MNILDETNFEKLNYETQLDVKNKYLSTLYDNKVLFPITSSPKNINYRHKVVLSATTINNKLKLGLYEEGSKNVKPTLNNNLHDADINEIYKTIEQILNKYKLSAYDIDKNVGIIKHILIRKSFVYKTFLIVIVTNGSLLPNAKNICKDIVSSNYKIETIIQNIQNKKTHLVLLENEKILYGCGYIYDEINGIKYRLSSQSFYQVNPIQMINLYNKVIELGEINKNSVVLDCYSGIGTITLLASRNARAVIGVEVNKSSHMDAVFNKKLNKIDNAIFVNEDVEKYIVNLEKIDVLIMDPTREGASKAFLDAVLKMMPKKIIYVSCEPITQVRDFKTLLNKYDLKCVHPFDMFPNTCHVECVALLERK